MLKFLGNYGEELISNAKKEFQIVREFSKVPGVEENTIESHWEYVNAMDNVREYIEHRSKELVIEFRWHDHKVMVTTHYDGSISMYADNEPLANMYWSIRNGWLTTDYANNIEMKKWQTYLVSILQKIMIKLENAYEHIEYTADIKYDKYEIIVDRSRLLVKNIENGETYDIMGHTFTGTVWHTAEPKYCDVVKFIQKNFTVKGRR